MLSERPLYTKMTDKDIKRTNLYLSAIDRILQQKTEHVGVAQETLDNAKESAINHHFEFLKECSIRQETVDVYKILSWYGFEISKHADDKKKLAVLACMQVMNCVLKNEKFEPQIPEVLVEHLWEMSQNDGVNDDYGIGKNGVYSVFTTASMVLEPFSKKYTGHIVPTVV